MATKPKFARCYIAGTPTWQSTVGYKVIADYPDGQGRTIVLERPETSPTVPTKRRAKRTTQTPQNVSNAQETASQEVSK